MRLMALYDLIMPVFPNTVRAEIRSLAILISGNQDRFLSVSVETVASCNRGCVYCPNSNQELRSARHSDLGSLVMLQGLYEKIISDLKSVDYRYKLAFGHFGEPFLDRSIVDKVAFARISLPHSAIVINSNGDYLTPDLLQDLVSAGVDRVIVTDHNSKDPSSPRPTSEEIQILRHHLECHPALGNYVVFNGLQKLSNRGGLVSIPRERRKIRSMCEELNSVNIDAAGNVVLCSNDYLGSYKFGNVKESPLAEIWNSAGYRAMRQAHSERIFTEDICIRCISG
ncbi:SPASM domain-containing protein [Candidatus Woesearchaeota archaeon]|nr:SPASM domain-containing protein [Candidatus Woesearchaeota archaeon]